MAAFLSGLKMKAQVKTTSPIRNPPKANMGKGLFPAFI